MRITFKAYDKLMPLDEMRQSPDQTNKHPKEQIERLARIMKECGVRHPIAISNRSNKICFGHARKAAALLNNWKEYPVVFQDFASDAEERVCVSNDNAIALWAELDNALINEFVVSEGPDIDVDLWGIEDFVIEPIEKFEIDGIPKPEKKLKTCPNCSHEF